MINVENITCYLPVEVKTRELDTKIYLAKCLADKGFSVIIGRKSGVNKNMFSQKKPFIYFCKGISPAQLDFYKAVKASKGLLVEIQEECNVSENTELLIWVHDNPCVELFSMIFTWGKFAAETLEQKCPKISKSQIINTGHPSFDLLHDDLINYYHKLRKLNHDIEPEYILINTNFASFNGVFNFEHSKLINDSEKELFSNKRKETADKVYKFERDTLSEFIKMIKYLSKSFNDKTFVVRPHPVENSKVYEEQFKEHFNVIVSKEGSSKEWIAGAKCVIHHDCTTGIEAFIAKKNVISFCPLVDRKEKFISELPRAISIKLDNIKDISDYISRGYRLEKPDSVEIQLAKMQILKKFIANTNQKATDKIIASIENLFSNLNTDSPFFLKRIYYLAKLRYVSLIRLIKTKIFGKKTVSQYLKDNSKIKFLSLTKKEILERLEIWNEQFSLKQEYTINQLQPDTFLIKNTKYDIKK